MKELENNKIINLYVYHCVATEFWITDGVTYLHKPNCIPEDTTIHSHPSIKPETSHMRALLKKLRRSVYETSVLKEETDNTSLWDNRQYPLPRKR
jgi:hypothetical protein